MKIFVINMKKDTDRRVHMQTLLDGLSLSYSFIDAVVGRDVPETTLRQFTHHSTMTLSRPEYGCLLSHVEYWKHICDESLPHALVLEDDVHLSPGFETVVQNIAVDPDIVGVYRLETFLASVNASAHPVQRIGAYRVYEIFTHHGGTAGYVVNRKTAAFLLQNYHDIRNAIDVELFSPERRSIAPLRILQCVPGVCAQDMILGLHGGGGGVFKLPSNIAATRADLQDGFLDEERKIAKWAKRVFRPIYLFLYSLGLRLSNKQRIRVTYG